MVFRLSIVLLISVQTLMVGGQDAPDCNANLRATGVYQSTQSPGYPFGYQNGLHCVTHITAHSHSYVIELSIIAFNLEESEDCYKDVLAVYDGVDRGSRLIQHSCGQVWAWPHYPEKVITSGPNVTIVFITDGDTVGTGYQFHFKEVEPDPGIIFFAASDFERIHAIHRHSAINFRVQPSGLDSPQAVDYDPVGKHVYYTDKGAMNIGRVHLPDQRTDILHVKAITDPFGLRVDIVNRLLYWTDAVEKTISVSDLDGTQRMTIISGSDIDKLGAIVVDPYEGYIYFTDWGDRAKIERADGDGLNRRMIVEDRISSPQGLAIDLKERALYWVDTLLDTLEKSDLEGRNRFTYQPYHERDFFGIALDEEGFFMTDTKGGWIELVDRSGSSSAPNNFRVHVGAIRKPLGITLRPQYLTKNITPYTCPRDDCSGLCLPKPRSGHVCKAVLPVLVTECPDDIFNVQPDNYIDWMEPNAASPLGLPVSRTSTHSPGVFNSGIYNVVYFFEDTLGNKRSCNFTVILSDRYRLTCPNDISITAKKGAVQTTVSWTPPRGRDGQPATNSTHNPGDSFPIGVTTVTYRTMFDNNQQSCSFTITIREGDNVGPTFKNCPGNSTKWISVGTVSAFLDFSNISLEDPNDFIVSSPFDLDSQSGHSEFYRGENRINIQAEDREGNVAWCNFTVNVKVDTISPVIVGCPEDITVPAKGNSTKVTWRSPSATDNSGSVVLQTNHEPGDSFSLGAEAVSYTASDLFGNVESCSFVVTVERGDPNSAANVSGKNDDSHIFITVGSILGFLLIIIIAILIVLAMRCRGRTSRPLIEESPPTYDYPIPTVGLNSGHVNPALAMGGDGVRYSSNVDTDAIYDPVPVPPPTYRELQVNIADEIKKSIPPDEKQ